MDRIIKILLAIPLFFLGGFKYLIVSVLMFIMMTAVRMAFSFALTQIDASFEGKLQEFVIDGLAGWLLSVTRTPEAINVILSAYMTKLIISAIPFLRK